MFTQRIVALQKKSPFTSINELNIEILLWLMSNLLFLWPIGYLQVLFT